MSHDLEINEAGEAQMFSAEGVVPWHGLGKVFEQDGLTSAEALVAAGQDWTVELVPTAQLIGVDEETGENIWDETPGDWSVQRSSDLRSVGKVKGRYNPLNNVDAFAFGDDILGLAEGAHWITGGCLKEGSLVWMMAKLPTAVHIGGFEDEAIQPYIMVSNSHDGSKAVEASVVTVRVVCNNTFTAALSGAKRTHKIRHTKNMAERMAEAKTAINVVDTYSAELRKTGDLLIGQSFSNGDFDKFLETLVPTKGLDAAPLTKAENKQEAIKVIWANKPDLQNIKNTKWGVLQAIIDYNDHSIVSRGDNKAEKRMSRILMPMTANIGHKALDLLTV